MPYTINFTDVTNKGSVTVEDNDINQSTSLSFVGRNTTSYGVEFNQNFLKLLENFANLTSPSNPVEGQLWYDSTAGNEQLKVYDGTNWVASGGLKKATSEPGASNSLTGDLWVDTDNQQLYLYTGSGWTLIGPEYAGGLSTGISPVTILAQDNIEYTSLQVEIDAKPVAIISTHTFTPRAEINGFSQINPGINLSTADITGSGAARFYGPAEQAENLVVAGEKIAAANFLRGDVVSTTTSQLKVNTDDGIILGSGNQVGLGVEGQIGVISHNTSGASLDIRVNDQGTTKTVMRVDSTTNIGINNTAPSEALDVTGNIKVSQGVTIDGTTASTNFGTGSLIVKGGVGVAGDVNIGGTINIIGDTETRDIIPDITNTRNIGSLANKYTGIYATTFIGNLTGNVTGQVSGRAGSADKLSSSTNFTLAGEVSAPTITFDGQAGGTTKTFQTTVANSFISNKTYANNADASDEFLLNRVQGQVGLYRISRRDLLSTVPVNPPGVMMPYAGTTAPLFWLLCHGQEVLQADYQALFEIIGFTYKQSGLLSDLGVAKFALPDMRGRTAMGLDDMGGTGAGRITGLQGSELGNSGGQETVTIQNTNLPDHEHDLVVEGTQFYAILDAAKGANSPVSSITFDAPTGQNAGQAVTTSGGVAGTTGQAMETLTPFMSLNYIIYTGKV
jgi:microcystin-dependent protein|tara:strand:- start:6898 stop:8922 length:2025 start_codon:yes stop_codon:yes gene_type:complete